MSKNNVEGALNDRSHFVLKVGLLEVLDLVQHGDSSIVEGGLGVQLAVSKEVDESSLLNKFVFSVNSIILNLLFGVSQMVVL